MIKLITNEHTFGEIVTHLIPTRPLKEEAAFLFGKYDQHRAEIRLLRCRMIGPNDYQAQEIDYLELRDGVRGEIIREAHAEQSCIIEAHSHPTEKVAAFSAFDIQELRKTVPHMLWRLPNQPYVSLVFGTESFDGLVWLPGSKMPIPLGGLVVSEVQHQPTNISRRKWERYQDVKV